LLVNHLNVGIITYHMIKVLITNMYGFTHIYNNYILSAENH